MAEEIALQPQALFWLHYSQQLSAAIRYPEALAAVQRALDLEPTWVEALYGRGTYLAMLARYDEALADFERALALNASYVPAWDGLAWVLGILGHKTEALAAVEQALTLDPNYFDAQKRKERLAL